jgi:catechol 2,3-dioxygenase-like lactoylglutathione lyase family enzyme
MIEIETLHHVSISVTDLASAKHFYGKILGLCELERPQFDFPGAWYALGNRQLHLIVHTHPQTLRGTSEIDSRDGHLRSVYAAIARHWNTCVPIIYPCWIGHVAKPPGRRSTSQILTGT